MADEGSILAIAEAELRRVQALHQAHLKSCPMHAQTGHHGCPDCLSLSSHLDRCERQVQLLTAPVAEPETALF